MSCFHRDKLCLCCHCSADLSLKQTKKCPDFPNRRFLSIQFAFKPVKKTKHLQWTPTSHAAQLRVRLTCERNMSCMWLMTGRMLRWLPLSSLNGKWDFYFLPLEWMHLCCAADHFAHGTHGQSYPLWMDARHKYTDYTRVCIFLIWCPWSLVIIYLILFLMWHTVGCSCQVLVCSCVFFLVSGIWVFLWGWSLSPFVVVWICLNAASSKTVTAGL